MLGGGFSSRVSQTIIITWSSHCLAVSDPAYPSAISFTILFLSQLSAEKATEMFASDPFIEYIGRSADCGCGRARRALEIAVEQRKRLGSFRGIAR